MELDRFVNISPLTCGTVLIFFNRMHWRGTGGGSFSSRFCCALLCELLQCAALGSCGKWKWKSFSRVWLCNPMDYMVHRILQARILELEAFPFSRGSSQPRDRTQVSCTASGFFTSWATREALLVVLSIIKVISIRIEYFQNTERFIFPIMTK